MSMSVGSGAGFDRMFNGSVGMQVNRMLDALGLPDQVGDLIGAQIDAQRGDIRGMMRNLADATSGLSTGSMDKLFGKGLPSAHFVPRPAIFSPLGGLLGGFRPSTLTPMGFRPVGLNREAPLGTGFVGRQMEREIRSNPLFKAQMEQALGGRILLDGRNDGKLTVFRSPFPNVGGIMRDALAGGLLPKLGIAAALGGLNIPLAGAIAGNAVARTILGGLQRAEANIASLVGGATGQGNVNPKNDPSLKPFADTMGISLGAATFEDIMFLLLMKYAKNKENDVKKKVDDLDKSMKKAEEDKKNGTGEAGKSGGGKGGVFGGLLGGLGNMLLPGVGGFLGKTVGGIVDGVAGTGGAGGASRAGGTQGSSGGSGLDSAEMGKEMNPENMSETMKQQVMQKLMQDLQKVYEMLSNMMKAFDSMSKGAVQNLRG